MKFAAWRDKSYPMLAAWILAIIVLTGFALSNGPLFGNNSLGRLPAVTIKTQAAADSIQGGIRGIDVSKWQGSINWTQVAKDNVKFAFIRSSYGKDADPYFVTNARGANENGIKVGAYHYATFNSRASMLEEAKFFVEQLKKVTITYPVVLDMELHKGLGRGTLTDLAVEFMEYVKKSGYTVMFYSYETFFERYLDKSKLAPYQIWVANYIEQPKTIGHHIWQHTSAGSVKGISGNVDINIAYKDMSTRKQIRVNKEISDTVKTFLNETYSAGIDITAPLDYAYIEACMQRGLQTEINRQLGGQFEITGEMTQQQLNSLSTIGFRSETKGNITTIIQCRLFYKGYYTDPITGHFDAHTTEALAAFQRDSRLNVTSTMDSATWFALFPPIDK